MTTRYFYDLEFLEDGRTIDLVSIGIVSSDGREYYAVNSDAPWDQIKNNDWLSRNVWPRLPVVGCRPADMHFHRSPRDWTAWGTLDDKSTLLRPRWLIRNEVEDFLLAVDGPIQLWADHGAYDHVALAQLWGPMVALPVGVPQWTHDIQQEAEGLGVTELPAQTAGLHNALEDARHLKRVFDQLRQAAMT